MVTEKIVISPPMLHCTYMHGFFIQTEVYNNLTGIYFGLERGSFVDVCVIKIFVIVFHYIQSETVIGY